MPVDLSKQQAFDAHAKKSRSSRRCNNVFHYCRSKRNHFRSEKSKGTVKLLWLSLYNLAHIAYVANVFDRNACSTILFCSI